MAKGQQEPQGKQDTLQAVAAGVWLRGRVTGRTRRIVGEAQHELISYKVATDTEVVDLQHWDPPKGTQFFERDAEVLVKVEVRVRNGFVAFRLPDSSSEF